MKPSQAPASNHSCIRSATVRGRAGKSAGGSPGAVALSQLRKAQARASRQFGDLAVMPFDTWHVEILGQDLILWEAREIDAEMIGQCREAGFRMRQFVELVVQRLGLLLRVADHRD